MHKLGEAIPTLIQKLDELQNHSAQMPNISESISRIRQLIKQARNAASKVRVRAHTSPPFQLPSLLTSIIFFFEIQVSVSVKFNGKSAVQVRTPSNLADLAAYTSLKFYITLPEGTRGRRQDDVTKQFVFYLGNKNVSIAADTFCACVFLFFTP